MKRGRPKEYTPDKLRRAVERYFNSITREITVTEQVETGQRDEKGHMIYRAAPVVNNLGQEVRITEYIVPPSVADLSEFLGIHRSTWDNYRDKERYPELAETTQWVHERLQAWNERELLTRSGKDLKGILFNLENNYGYSERREVEFGPRASKSMAAASIPLSQRQALLQELAAQVAREGAEWGDAQADEEAGSEQGGEAAP